MGIGVLVISSSLSTRDSFDVKHSFAILRSSSESPRKADLEIINNVKVVDPTAQAASTHLASRRDGLWVVSTEELLCITQARGAACGLQEEAAKRGILLGTFQPPTQRHPKPHAFQLQGLVPDDVAQVLLIEGARRFRVDVRRNFFSVERNKPVHFLRLLRTSP